MRALAHGPLSLSLSLLTLCYFSSSFSGCRSCKHRRPSPALRCTVYVWLHDCILYKRRGRHCRHLLHTQPSEIIGKHQPTTTPPARNVHSCRSRSSVSLAAERQLAFSLSLWLRSTPGRQQQLSSTERVQSLFIHCCHPHVYGHFFFRTLHERTSLYR